MLLVHSHVCLDSPSQAATRKKNPLGKLASNSTCKMNHAKNKCGLDGSQPSISTRDHCIHCYTTMEWPVGGIHPSTTTTCPTLDAWERGRWGSYVYISCDIDQRKHEVRCPSSVGGAPRRCGKRRKRKHEARRPSSVQGTPNKCGKR